MKVRQFFPVVLATVAVALVTGGLTPKSVDLMIAEGRDDSHAKALLDQLCSTIGGRATGTPELARAEQWALAKFKSYGLENVHLEKWGTAPQTFERGPRQVGRVVAPFERDLVFTTNCYTSGTQGPVRGPVYREPVTPDEAFRMGEKLKGAWILMPGIVSMGGARLANPSAMDRRLDLAGIAGRIYT
ncbi:MAG TPA: hypothetical protein VNI20_13815, partial [Fimbriimonadaceae bacterium]|nr:hypothetical protein [Fimbriimonadaceae bacterium]